MKVIRTTEGYMVEQADGDYLCDEHGDNLWDTRLEAESVIDIAQGGQGFMMPRHNLGDNMTRAEVDMRGKTVESISYPNPWDEGITITFTDGSKLNVYERMQAGEIMVTYNDNEVIHDRGTE